MQGSEKRTLLDSNLVQLKSKCVRSEDKALPTSLSEPSEEDSDGSENQLDLDLSRKSRRLNLTRRNVRTILHEVITHEQVVDMMKAAIRDTQDLPLFEPKMTRSRLKLAVEQGQKLNWSLSAVGSSNRSSGFVDMKLEEEEDSSDEEYCPNEDEEDDTTDEPFLSDGDSLASPPRMYLCSPPKAKQSSHHPRFKPEDSADSFCATLLPSDHTHLTDSFLERFNAVEEELNSSPAYFYQVEESLACRTRSKLPLVNVPINRLEAELLAPDITADMYSSPTHQLHDPHWMQWLQGLVAPDNGEEAEDEDDPEYNFLEDLDEPDQEDYRTDRAVQITKKEVNKLLEELFETLQDQAVEEEEPEELGEPEEEELDQTGPQFNIPQALRLEAPLTSVLTEQRRNVRRLNQSQRKALQDTTNTSQNQALNQLIIQDIYHGLNQDQVAQDQVTHSHVAQLVLLPGSVGPALHLNHSQKLLLQQQIQQHVQLLTQVHLLTKGVEALSHEANLTKHFLVELDQFSHCPSSLSASSFKVCNLQPALDLIEEQLIDTDPAFHRSSLGSTAVYAAASSAALTAASAGSKRWLPSMTPATNSHAFPLLPATLAWLFATRPVFLYPELLPVCSLNPAYHAPRQRKGYTQGEDGLIVLGLKHFEGSVDREQLITDFLLCKKRRNIMKHIREMSSSRAPPNIIKCFLASSVVPPLPVACSRVDPSDQRPPVDRDCSHSPNWLKNSRELIQRTCLSSSPPSYPPCLPFGCTLRLHPHWLAKARSLPPQQQRRLFTLAHNAALMPLAKKHECLEQETVKTQTRVEQNGQNDGKDEKNGTVCLTLSEAKVLTSGELPKENQSDDILFSKHNQVLLLNSELNSQKQNFIPLLLPFGSTYTPLIQTTAPTIPLPLIPPPPALIHTTGPTAYKQPLIRSTTPRDSTVSAIPDIDPVIPTAPALMPHTPYRIETPPPILSCTKTPATTTMIPLNHTIISGTGPLAPVIKTTNALRPTITPTTGHIMPDTSPVLMTKTPLIRTTTSMRPSRSLLSSGDPKFSTAGSLLIPTTPSVSCTTLKIPDTRTTNPIIGTTSPIMSGTVVLPDVHPVLLTTVSPTGPIKRTLIKPDTRPQIPVTQPIIRITTPVKDSPALSPEIVVFPIVWDGKPESNFKPQRDQFEREDNEARDRSGERKDEEKTEKERDFIRNVLGSEEGDGNDEKEGEGASGEGREANERQGGNGGEEGRANEGQEANEGGENGGERADDGEGGAEGQEGAGPGEGGGDEGGDEEEEEEEFDDLTQDEDEEEIMSSASEESVLSVPELQETMKQLTWLAAERRLCGDADSEEDLSQEEEEEEEEDGNTKGEESREEGGNEARGDEETTVGEEVTRGGVGRGPARGRGRSRPPRGLKRSRQDRLSKNASRLLLLYDENILENDPYRESKDTAFAQSYLNRVREALLDTPLKMEQFVSLLGEFENVGEGQEVVGLFRKLQYLLGHRTDLLQDFAAFLRPEQALECGVFEEQQAFDRSRRFLRQLEISFGDNPSHYQKIIKALQIGPDISPTSMSELKSQMAYLLKGHTHLQSEFWVFFDDLRPTPARPGQFEEAHWIEEAEGTEAAGLSSGGGNVSGFEEVTLPELEEEEEGHKIRPMAVRRQRRKMDSHRNYKECDWSDKSWVCLCHDAKIRKHRKKGCPRCRGNKGSVVVSRAMKSLDPLYSQINSDKDQPKEEDQSHQLDRGASWEMQFPLNEEKDEEEEDEDKDEPKTEPAEKKRREQTPPPQDDDTDDVTDTLSPVTPPLSDVSDAVTAPPFPQELPVCAKNISLTASGEKVILWTREADRVILTRCQQEGANPSTFQEISSVLANKTPSEVSQRFRDLMRLFRSAARHTSSEDEALSTEPAAANQGERL